jgi:hypothetical protein
MNARTKKVLLLLLAAVLLFGSGRMQQSLNRDRDQLGLVRASALQNAPPMLAFTTVALGGFRGLISNLLWIRANDLQLDDKFFEAAQLADWITDLEPHFSQVWLFQAWNMAYNISIKFKDFPDRWRWVERSIELLRDDGLRYNPDDVLIYRELAWFFQHKMGQNLDDANMYFKQQWAVEMTPFFGANGTNFDALLQPQTAGDRTNALRLREKYKIDAAFAKNVDAEWGPLDWRSPEAHAIYWGAFGLGQAKKHPDKVNPDDLIRLRRIIYQSMLQAFHHGRFINNPFSQSYEQIPDLDLAAKVNEVYEKMYAEETQPNMRDGIQKAHRYFLGDAVYLLYEDNRVAEAAEWYRYLARKYPDDPTLSGDANSRPAQLTFEQYAIARVQEDVGDTSQERTAAMLEGLLTRAYIELAIGQDDRYAGFKLMAGKIYENYQVKTADFQGAKTRIVLPAFASLNRTALNRLLDPQQGLPFAARAVLRTQLGMPPETNAPAPAVSEATNAPASASK